MGWATAAIQQLQAGESVTLRPRGHSMAGKVENGEVVRIAPIGDRALAVGDIVRCKVRGHEYLHLIKAIRPGERYLIGNNRGGTNGWIGRTAIFGMLVRAT